MIRVYLAGPYSADTREGVERNVLDSMKAQARLEDAGLAVLNPLLRHFLDLRHPRPYEHHMAQDLAFLPSCDVYVRRPGPSLGADREEARARELGLAVYTVE